MEELTLRFPYSSENIFNLLDNESIVKCMEASKFLKNYLDNQKLLDIRKITATVKQFQKVGKSWKMVFETGSTSTIRDLWVAVGQFYEKGKNKQDL